MRRVGLLALVFSLMVLGIAQATPAPEGRATGLISVVALDANQRPLAGAVVNLRARTGSLAGQAVTNAYGEITFSGLSKGDYIVQVLSPNSDILIESTPIVLASDNQQVTGLRLQQPLAMAESGVGAGNLGGNRNRLIYFLIGGAAAIGVITYFVVRSSSS